MKFWGRRKKKTATNAGATLSLEKLEDRAMLAVMPLVSGQTTSFRDADGTLVRVQLIGPGQGTLELTNGATSFASIENLTLTGTTGESSLKITANGGSISGTTVRNLVIDNAIGQLWALHQINAPKVDIAVGGHWSADGYIDEILIRDVRENAEIDVAGNLGMIKARSFQADASLDVTGRIRKVVVGNLSDGSEIEADQIDFLQVKQQAYNTTIDVGAGGLNYARFKNLYQSVITADGGVGDVFVKCNMLGTTLASNIDAGSDGEYGTIDDFVIDSAASGDIHSLQVRGRTGWAGTMQEVIVIASGNVGEMKMGRHGRFPGAQPTVWKQAASQFVPLSITQLMSGINAFDDDKIWIAVYGEETAIPSTSDPSPTGQEYYLVANNLDGGSNPKYTTTATLVPSASTPDLPIIPSSKLSDWKNATKAWGSNLAFKVPGSNMQWSGRIIISAGAPVQAQVNQDADHTVSAPNPVNPGDPSTGTFYDFLEFTITNNGSSVGVDVDTSLVDAFGLPMSLQLMQNTQPLSAFNFPLSGTTDGTNVIRHIKTSDLHTAALTGLGKQQPIIGANFRPGTMIVDYDIAGGTITMNMPPIASQLNSAFTVVSAGPVGVAQDRDVVFSGGNNLALYQFLQNKIAAGSTAARPFLQSAAPFAAAGSSPLTGVQILPATINTTQVGDLNAGDVITISGVQGINALNGRFVVDVVTQTQLTLGGPLGNGAYTHGGTWSVDGVTPAAITGASNNNSPIIITSTPASVAQINVGDVVTISGVQGNTAANGKFLVAAKSGGTFTLGSPVGSETYTSNGTWSPATVDVTGADNTSPIKIHTGSTAGLLNGDSVTISDVHGNTAANGTYTVQLVTNDSFELVGTSGNGAYTGGGTWTPVFNITGATNGGQVLVLAESVAGLTNGDFVSISGILGPTDANGGFTVGNVGTIESNSFTLNGLIGNRAYTSLGTWAFAITGATTSKAVITAANTTGLSNGDRIIIDGVGGNTAVNGEFFITGLTPTSFELAGSIGNAAYTSGGYWTLPNAATTPIYGAANNASNMIRILTGNTVGLANGDTVVVSGVQGNTAANGVFTVGNVDEISFTLTGATSSGTYGGGGTWQVVNPISGASNGNSLIQIDTNDTNGLAVGGVVQIAGVGGNTAANGLFVIDALSTNSSITLGSPASTTPYTTGGTWHHGPDSATITGATNGGQIVITASSTGNLANGDSVNIAGVLGNTAANNFYQISNVTGTSFVLDGSLGNGTFQASQSNPGQFVEYTTFSRLFSPKDVVEWINDASEPSTLNNYFNESIDEFFLKYLPSTEFVNGHQGGGELLIIESTASGSAVQYVGQVTNSATENGGYVMRFAPIHTTPDPTAYDPNSLDIYYPFFESNLPSPDVYTPLFPVEAAPTWITDANQEGESASGMIFGCNGVFADNLPRQGDGMQPTPSKILGDLENSIVTAFNRGVALNPANEWDDIFTWFPATGTYNYWVEYWHQPNLTFNDLAYAFAYDDKFGASTNLNFSGVGQVNIQLGAWSATATATMMAFQSPPTTAAAGSVVNLTVSGIAPTAQGTVSFFIDGRAINRLDSGATPDIDPIEISSGSASISANLPALSAPGHTYTLTAVYSGDSTHLPSIAYVPLSIT